LDEKRTKFSIFDEITKFPIFEEKYQLIT